MNHIIWALVIWGVVAFAFVSVVRGDHYPNSSDGFLPWMPQAVQDRIYERGYGTYVTTCETIYPGFKSDLWKVFIDEAVRGGVHWVEVSNDPDLILCPTYQYPGKQGSVGTVIGLYGPPPAIIYYNLNFLYPSYDTTIGHEQGHADGQFEEYDDTNFLCLPDRTWTRMSCGTGTWWLTAYDLERVRGMFVPCRISGPVYSEDWSAIFYGSGKEDGCLSPWATVEPNTTWVCAVTFEGEAAWVSSCDRPAHPGEILAVRVDSGPGRAYGLVALNRVGDRGTQIVGVTP